MKKNITSSTKNTLIKSTEYPIMYSYIYEREPQDIKRLSDKFKHLKVKKATVVNPPRVITGYKIENGIAVPQFENSALKAALILRGGTISGKFIKTAPKKKAAAKKKAAPKK